MKTIISITFLFFISCCAFAQTPDTPAQVRYLLPGGKIVNADKLDSVLKSWNHQPFSMLHRDDQPGLVELVPQTDAMKKQLAEERRKANVMLNQPAPNFDLTDIYGKAYRLSEFKGKVVVLNFWFTSCAPCRDEMPLLNKIKNGNDPQKVIFLALALDNAAAVRKFSGIREFDYNLLVNAKDVHAAYHVESCPTSMVIDKNGIVRFVQSTGDKIDENLSAAIKSVL